MGRLNYGFSGQIIVRHKLYYVLSFPELRVSGSITIMVNTFHILRPANRFFEHF